MVVPDTLDVMKLIAIKETKEKINLGDKDIEVQKAKITLPDWRSLFWASYAWFRIPDGVLVKTEELRGPPGSPIVKMKLIKVEG